MNLTQTRLTPPIPSQQPALAASQQRLLSISCQCDVQKYGYIDQEIKRKEKNKMLNVFRVDGSSNLRFQLRYQKCGDLVLDFALEDITRIINTAMQGGKLTIQFAVKNATSKVTVGPSNIMVGAGARSGLPSGQQQQSIYTLLLNQMEPSLISGLCKLISEEKAKTMPNAQQQAPANSNPALKQTVPKIEANDDPWTRKRKLDQITEAQQHQKQMLLLQKNKVRRLNAEDQAVTSSSTKSKVMPSYTIDMLPYELLGLIMDFSPRKEVYPLLKQVNKLFFNLTSQRKRGLTLSRNDITQIMFFRILDKSKSQITSLTLKHRTLPMVSPSTIEKHLLVIPRLQELDMLSFSNSITDVALARLINGCTKSLTSLRFGYGASSSSLGFATQSVVALAKCRQLKRLVLGDIEEGHKTRQLDGRLYHIKRLIQHKQFTLEYLTLYQVDAWIIEQLAAKQESESLVQLAFAQYLQGENGLDEIVNLKKLANLQSLNMASTYFPLDVQIQLPDEHTIQNNQQLSIAGSRELELLIFSLKSRLRVLHLGQYMYDELLTYLAEMCHDTLEKLELNSEKVTDRGLTPVFIKLAKLKLPQLHRPSHI